MKELQYSYENRIWRLNKVPAGVDEAGRGPIAGPVVAAAVILRNSSFIGGINDSKKLSVRKREELCCLIKENCIAYSVGIVEPEEIDRINILNAALKAMEIAVNGLHVKPDFLYIDGNKNISSVIPQETIIRGDSVCPSVAAASIIAKVERDSIMEKLHGIFPDYNFIKHKGYPTPEHLDAVKNYGPSPVHRKSFKGVMNR